MLKTRILLAGVLLCGTAAARGPAPEAAADRERAAGPPGIGVELRGDTLVYRAVGRSVAEDPDGRRYRLRPWRRVPGPRHSISLEAGFLPICGDEGFVFGTDEDRTLFFWDGAFPGEQRYYEGPLRTSGALSAVYVYRVKRWLEVGASVTYTGFYRTVRRSADGGVAWRRHDSYLSVMPLVRISWFNRTSVRLYSSFQLGWQHSSEQFPFDREWVENQWAVQVTLFGVSVGRRFFGYAECGIGMRGLAVAGVGYRFGPSKTSRP